MKLKKPTIEDLYVYIFITTGVVSAVYLIIKLAGWLMK